MALRAVPELGLYSSKPSGALATALGAGDSQFSSRPSKLRGSSYVPRRQDQVFADAEPWKKFLSQQDFAFGTRIHGNIAALASGTPAMLLAHDSRTLELARFHGMPYIEMPSDPTQVDASKLYSETEPSEFNARRAPNRARWHEFLQRNRVPSIHDKGCSNPDYTRLLEATSHPGGALPVSAASREELAARLRWIWQGIQTDQYRPFEAYEPRFEPRTQARRSSHEIATAVEKETKRIRAEVADLTSAVRAAQKTSVQTQAELDDFRNYLGVPFERRVLRALKHRLRRLFKRV